MFLYYIIISSFYKSDLFQQKLPDEEVGDDINGLSVDDILCSSRRRSLHIVVDVFCIERVKSDENLWYTIGISLSDCYRQYLIVMCHDEVDRRSVNFLVG